MSGILENMVARIEALEAAVKALQAGGGGAAASGLGGLGALSSAPVAPPVKTSEELQALITPVVQDADMLNALKADIAAAGYPELGAVPADQYGKMFQIFSATIERVKASKCASAGTNTGII